MYDLGLFYFLIVQFVDMEGYFFYIVRYSFLFNLRVVCIYVKVLFNNLFVVRDYISVSLEIFGWMI